MDLWIDLSRISNTAKLTAQSPGSPGTQPSELERGAPPWSPSRGLPSKGGANDLPN